MKLSEKKLKLVLQAQQNEITEYFVYKNLAKISKNNGNSKNAKILNEIAKEEKMHYGIFEELSGQKVKPSKSRVLLYGFIARTLGITFGLRLMERGEKSAQNNYEQIKNLSPKIPSIIKDEKEHEHKLIDLLHSKALEYISSIVLGLNDALVELTGALAGLTLALQDSRIIAIAGLITGIAASLSMGASEYLSTKEDGNSKNPLKASIYTGVAYLITVAILITPYLVMGNPIYALLITLGLALLIILSFTFYISVAKNIPLKKRFLEMASLSMGVAVINFFIGLAIRYFVGEI